MRNGLEPGDEFAEPRARTAAGPAQGTAVDVDEQPTGWLRSLPAVMTMCDDHTWAQILKLHVSRVGPEPGD